MDKKILEIACSVLKMSEQDVLKNHKRLDDINAYYFWCPQRGGLSMIVNDKGEKLAASSAISFNRLFTDFNNGRRN